MNHFSLSRAWRMCRLLLNVSELLRPRSLVRVSILISVCGSIIIYLLVRHNAFHTMAIALHICALLSTVNIATNALLTKNASLQLLTLPATTGEKYLAIWLTMLIYAPIVYAINIPFASLVLNALHVFLAPTEEPWRWIFADSSTKDVFTFFFMLGMTAISLLVSLSSTHPRRRFIPRLLIFLPCLLPLLPAVGKGIGWLPGDIARISTALLLAVTLPGYVVWGYFQLRKAEYN